MVARLDLRGGSWREGGAAAVGGCGGRRRWSRVRGRRGCGAARGVRWFVMRAGGLWRGEVVGAGVTLLVRALIRGGGGAVGSHGSAAGGNWGSGSD